MEGPVLRRLEAPASRAAALFGRADLAYVRQRSRRIRTYTARRRHRTLQPLRFKGCMASVEIDGDRVELKCVEGFC